MLSLIFNIHNRAVCLADQLRHIGLCPASFFSSLFDCQPEPMTVSYTHLIQEKSPQNCSGLVFLWQMAR